MFRHLLGRRGRKASRRASFDAGDLARLKPRYFPALHPDNDVPADQLARLMAGIVEDADDRRAPRIELLGQLLVKGAPEVRRVPLDAIGGVSQIRGGLGFNLARAPEHINLCNGDHFGPLSEAEMNRLWSSIRKDLGGFDEQDRIPLDYQDWDGHYIVANSGGAAHRFALWWRLQSYIDINGRSPAPVRHLDAIVTPITLNKKTLYYLQNIGRVVFCHHDRAIQEFVSYLRGTDARFDYIMPKVGGRFDATRPAALIIPRLAPSEATELAELHSWADQLFDLGRYLAERSTTYAHR